MSVRVAIVGRPNVGKSTLFNRLVGQRIALVDDRPGVTRDRREGTGRIGALTFTVIDTAGYEDATDDSLEARMRAQTEHALAEADLILFMVDARAGVTPLDEHFARILRKTNRPVHLIANKAEGKAAEPGLAECYALGFGDPVPLSAEHGLGLSDLHDLIVDAADAKAVQQDVADEDWLLPVVEVDLNEEGEDQSEKTRWDPTRALNIAIVGRPNVGKSTLINTLVGEERLLTGPEAGITRDSIMVPWRWNDRDIRLVDTAGIRRRAKVQQKLEKLAVSDSLRSIQYAEIVVLMIDATMPFEKQDLQLADLVVREGRGLVIAVNKWDLIKDKNEALESLREACERLLPQVRGVPMVTMSGLRGTNIPKLMKAVFSLEEAWNARISTGRLNRWLSGTLQAHPPPAVSGRRLKIRYATQIKSRPPTFVVFCSRPEALPRSYLRYLTNGIREAFNLPGTPIRLWARAGENPYESKAKKKR